MARKRNLRAGASREERLEALRETFYSSIDRETANPCWLWTKAKQQNGYGYCATRGLSDLPSKPAHIVSWLLHKDPSLDLNATISVHHKCFVVSCVNPEHLQIMTSYEQILHQEHTALGVLDKMELEFPEAKAKIEDLRKEVRRILGL